MLAVAIAVPLEILVESASVVFIIMFILASLSIIVLREGKVQNYRPVFHAPLYPYLQVLGIIGFIFVLFEMGEEAFLVAGLLLCAALSLYWFYGRRKRDAESALLHLIERITDRELITGNLEDELRDIIRKRDDIELDRLDQVVSRCIIVDLPKPLDAQEFFGLAAKRLAPLVHGDPGELANKLATREQEASTVLRPGVAVPHLVVDGQDVYEMLIARSKAGITFPDQPNPVHAAFVLMTSLDNRHLHLKVLAGLAQMLQNPKFDENWLHARNENRLRDLLLLGERMRIS
jgi:mannitol/fructose-specific phosphotransferase system IIA component (Ntr-type)